MGEGRSESTVNAGRSPASIVLIGLLGLAGLVYLLWPKGPAVDRLERSEAGSSWELREDRALLRGPTMGTAFTVVLVADEQELGAATLGPLQAQIDAELVAVNDEMSTYLPDSTLSRFNRSESVEPIEVGAELARVAALARQVSEASGGAFDVTVGPLVDAWGFGAAGQTREQPADAELDALRATIGYEQLEVDAEANTLRKRAPGLRVDLSAIAKGHGCDRVAGLLDAAGRSNYMVEIGGELRVHGHGPSGESWSVAIERPTGDAEGAQAVHAIVHVRDVALATSGDYRNYWERDGVRYSHTIDPRTARPTTHRLASVTIIHPDSAALADAWATAMSVLGAEEGLALAEQLGLAAYFLVRTDAGFAARHSAAFAPYLEAK